MGGYIFLGATMREVIFLILCYQKLLNINIRKGKKQAGAEHYMSS